MSLLYFLFFNPLPTAIFLLINLIFIGVFGLVLSVAVSFYRKGILTRHGTKLTDNKITSFLKKDGDKQ